MSNSPSRREDKKWGVKCSNCILMTFLLIFFNRTGPITSSWRHYNVIISPKFCKLIFSIKVSSTYLFMQFRVTFTQNHLGGGKSKGQFISVFRKFSKTLGMAIFSCVVDGSGREARGTLFFSKNKQPPVQWWTTSNPPIYLVSNAPVG